MQNIKIIFTMVTICLFFGCNSSNSSSGPENCDGKITDCAGVCGGNAIEDECGICDGDNLTCTDCDGIPNGDAMEDECGVCQLAYCYDLESHEINFDLPCDNLTEIFIMPNDPSNLDWNSNCQTIITSNIYNGNYYYDLVNRIETDSSSTWQISFQNKLVEYECTQEDVDTQSLCNNVGQVLEFSMPSLILGDVLAASYDLNYNDLYTYPSTFMQDAPVFDNTSVEYGGENVVIIYNMTTHQISMSESVLIVYYMGNHSVYKIQFNQYDSGYISFDFHQF